jgi:hypothetical protein
MYIGPSFLTQMNDKMVDLENTHKIILILVDTMVIILHMKIDCLYRITIINQNKHEYLLST